MDDVLIRSFVDASSRPRRRRLATRSAKTAGGMFSGDRWDRFHELLLLLRGGATEPRQLAGADAPVIPLNFEAGIEAAAPMSAVVARVFLRACSPRSSRGVACTPSMSKSALGHSLPPYLQPPVSASHHSSRSRSSSMNSRSRRCMRRGDPMKRSESRSSIPRSAHVSSTTFAGVMSAGGSSAFPW